MLLSQCLMACRQDDIIFIPENIEIGTPQFTDVDGFYILNEGNMGSNKATLDYYDFSAATYTRNIYGAANPDVPKELGDVGNDLAIYGSKMYAVINASNKIEVMDATDARRVGKIDLPNCRSVKCHDGYAYVTSYAGPIEINPQYTQKGVVAKIDTTTFQIVDRCVVGFQPDGIEIAMGKIYVANSGGYMVPNYENTISVIDIQTFKEERRIPIAINLDRLLCDTHGQLWVTSRGDYFDTEARLICYDLRKERVTASFNCSVSDLWLHDDHLYYVGTSWSNITMSNTFNYGIIDIATLSKISENFIADGTEKEIKIPYAVAVHPITGEIYVSDARNYVNPGYLHCYSPDGIRRWSVRTGDVPAHFAFVGKTLL